MNVATHAFIFYFGMVSFYHKDIYHSRIIDVKTPLYRVTNSKTCNNLMTHCIFYDDIIKWKYFPRHWPFVRGIHRSPVNSPHKDQWCGALTFSLVWAWTNGCVNNWDTGDLRHHRPHYDVTVMLHIYHKMWIWLIDLIRFCLLSILIDHSLFGGFIINTPQE